MPASRLAAALLAALVPALLVAQQPIDSAYTAKIRELTPTHDQWKFTTELVDHLPESDVPTPLDVLGYVPGTIGRLGIRGQGTRDENRQSRDRHSANNPPVLHSSNPPIHLAPSGTTVNSTRRVAGRNWRTVARMSVGVIARYRARSSLK